MITGYDQSRQEAYFENINYQEELLFLEIENKIDKN